MFKNFSLDSALKKTKVKLQLLTHADMRSIVEQDIRSRICDAINRYAKAHKEYMKHYDKNK